MNVLSLFDGISCARVALERSGIAVKSYTAVEIDKNATAISKKNYPEIIRYEDVRTYNPKTHYDLLIGGSPCQDLSIAKKDRKGLEGDRSGLFWHYCRIKDDCKPTWFVLENVASMPKKDKDIITKELGVEPVLFNASLVSAQSRKRLFWTNIPFDLPEDKGITLKDILQPDGEVDERMVMKGKAFCLTSTYSKVSPSENQIENSIKRKQRTMVKVGHIGNSDAQANRVYDTAGKSCTLSANGGGLGAKTGLYDVEDRIRKLTPIECERLQGLPDNYTEGVAMTHRYKCLGNAFNVDVVACILERLTRSM
jgi:DNA (cytosine-5)-methyltransferase 3A